MSKTSFGSVSLSIITLIFTPAVYASNTGSVTISGSIPVSTSVAVTAAAGSNTLDLTNTASNQTVATVVEASNSTTGYRVTLASANEGKLKNGSAGEITYTAKYNGISVTLTTEAQEVTQTGNTNSVISATKTLSISYTGQTATTMVAGTYSDTLTFTISAN